MEAFQDKDEPTQPIDLERLELDRASTEPTFARTTTRRRKSSYIGLVPLHDARCLPPGTELYGPQGQRGYIVGSGGNDTILFAIVERHGSERTESLVEVKPDAFCGWMTSGGVKL